MVLGVLHLTLFPLEIPGRCSLLLRCPYQRFPSHMKIGTGIKANMWAYIINPLLLYMCYTKIVHIALSKILLEIIDY